ncbi:guanylate-binding protein 1-like [Polypterus senegalus]|uniref:guanylate-binding protein 1-like n=1 Tax=Polypterus senegalus TaxID=55291 RepID=UPI001965E028|nr:guanylate-binding protein 1-like [Polypterus senegalus]XP_039629549.1 guanylate-binding protein 1-like [Polypterus senegalus]XP_039629550.1 guanylate-binding protein 1-like [Polypterus senegalus]XP_039629551.1 guanylate-binding protein 1-like [Polypterus senegalus]XP_039629553.1 guanylate-binding protein 1-like [Polypterus senegalus]
MATGGVKMSGPVCLIENVSGKLQINQKAVDILSGINQPVVVASIVGMYRTGKSYLMNKLAGQKKGFSLGSTIQSHTKGIWMWCVPHPMRDGQTLVLLDTEGLGDVEKGDNKNDNWIFALAVLLSSTLIYNSMGTINNDAVQNLHYVTELTELIKVKSKQEDPDESSEFARFFPSFVWAVRDFSLQLELNGRPVTADEYLENSLKLKPGVNKNVQNYNLPRECIRNYFPKRKCFVFERPSTVECMRKLEEMDESKLEKGFIEETKKFYNFIMRETSVKTLSGGITVTGRLLGNLATTYVDAILSGSVPCLENAVLALAQIENSTAISLAVAHYCEEMDKRAKLPTSTQAELSDVHLQCEKEAVKIFMERSFKDEDQKYYLELMKLLEEQYTLVCQRNEKESREVCSSLLQNLSKKMREAQNAGNYMKPGGFKIYQVDLEGVIRDYKGNPRKGIMADTVLNEFLRAKESEGKGILNADKSLSAQEKQIKEEQTKRLATERENEVIKKQQEILQKRIEDQKKAFDENIKQLQKKCEEEQKKAKEESERFLNVRLKEQQQLLEEGFEKKAGLLNEEINRLKQEVANESKPSLFGQILDTVGSAATLFMPGIGGKLLGVGTSLLSKLF